MSDASANHYCKKAYARFSSVFEFLQGCAKNARLDRKYTPSGVVSLSISAQLLLRRWKGWLDNAI